MKSRPKPTIRFANQTVFEQAMARARDWLEQGRLEKAFTELARLHTNPALAPEVIHLQASIAMQLREWPCALSLLEALMRVFPNRAVIHLDRATCLIALNRLGEARAILEMEATRLRNRHQRYVLLARVAALERKDAEAVVHLKAAFLLARSKTLAAIAQHPELSSFKRKLFQNSLERHRGKPAIVRAQLGERRGSFSSLTRAG